MIRAMCGVKLIEKRSSQELMDLLGLKETLDRLAKTNRIRWYGQTSQSEQNLMVWTSFEEGW